jgi:hypothetical protein
MKGKTFLPGRSDPLQKTGALTKKRFSIILIGKSGNSSMVERNLAKVDVAGSNPVSRSIGGVAKW